MSYWLLYLWTISDVEEVSNGQLVVGYLSLITFILLSRSLSTRMSHWLLYLWTISDAEEVSNGQLVVGPTPLCSMIYKEV